MLGHPWSSQETVKIPSWQGFIMLSEEHRHFGWCVFRGMMALGVKERHPAQSQANSFQQPHRQVGQGADLCVFCI